MKAILWRIIASSITIVLVFVITKSLPKASIVAVIDGGIKFFAYILHERLWNDTLVNGKQWSR